MPNSRLNISASSPAVMPCRMGTGKRPTKDANAESSTFPCTRSPPIGFGRSATTNRSPEPAAARIASAMVDTYV